ncbi:MAG: ABC transporter permease subunit [Kiritimatiellae bacterium]|nr:ABC transporter permease subunit [Kiritimatiellia bacterium]
MQRWDYFVRRLLLTIPTFVGITFLCFGVAHLVPGGPVEQRLAELKGAEGGESGTRTKNVAAISEEYRQALVKHFGFDLPLHKRYWRWLWTNRLGLRMESYTYPNKTAWERIRERLPVSLTFGLTGLFLTYLVCIPLGIAKALRHGRPFDLVSSAVVFVGFAIQPVALGMLLKALFCGTVDGLWDIFPLSGFHSEGFASLSLAGKAHDLFMHMFLPILCYMIGHFAVLTILMKNSLLEQISQDYVRTVLAKGGSSRRAIWGHAFRNSLIPIATGFGGVLTVMFAGAVIIEYMFEINGMGRLSYEAVTQRDYAVFMGIVSLQSILGLLGNILSDLSYVLIDPRISFDR